MSMRFICSAIKRRSLVVAYLQQHIPNLEVCWDTTGSAIGNYKKALELAGSDPFVFLEDDILITKNLVPKLERVVAERPADVIQFHSRCREDQTVGSRYRAGRSFYNHQCVYFPPGMASKLLRFGDQQTYSDPSNPRCFSDLLTQDFLAEHRIKYWVSIPSLVEHLPSVSATDARRAKTGIRRQARVFLDPESVGCPADLFTAWRPIK